MRYNSSFQVRTKNQRLLKLMLRSNAAYKFTLWLLGGRSLLHGKYPKKRIELFLNTFFTDVDTATGQMGKISWQRFFDGLATIDKNDSDLFGIGFFRQILQLMREEKSFQKYFLTLTRNVLLNELHRETLPDKQLLTFLTVDLTQRCNMQCAHCIANAGPKFKGTLDTNAAKRFIGEARRDGGLSYIIVLGGEPLLEVDKLIELASAFPYIPFLVFSNGSLITDEILQKIRMQYNVALFISMEGFGELTDKIRGSHAFEQANAALLKLQKSGIVFGISVTANKMNYKEIVSDAFANYIDSMGCHFLWIFDYKPIGRAGEDDEMRKLIMEQAEAEYVNNAVTQINKRSGFLCLNTERGAEAIGGCPAYNGRTMHVSCDGFITPCVAVRHYREDISIFDHSYTEALETEFLRSFKEIGHGEGCPGKFHPEELADWRQAQNTKLLGSKNA
jgi:MoaA/NifB/PqqE/SkfB family radical SAM enzyme